MENHTSWRSAAALLIAAGLAATPAGGQEREVVLRGGTLLPVSGPAIPGGSVSFRGGVITAVGSDVTPGPGAQVIDVEGAYVMPGIVDPHSHLGIGPWPWVSGHSDVNDPGPDAITPHLRAIDAFHPDDPALLRVAAGGVTTIMVLPGSGSVVSGQGAVMKLRLGATPEEMLFEGAPRVMKWAVGENPKATYGGQGRMPKTRMGIFSLLRQALTRAAAYRDEWDAWQALPEAERGPPPRRDPELEALADVLRGEIRAHVHTYRRDEFLNLLRLSDEFGFEIGSFQHAMDAYRVAPELARRGVGVSVYADAFGRKLEHWEQVPQTAALLSALGAVVSLHSDFPFFAQRLHTEAAKLVRYADMDERAALATITLNAARVVGVDEWVGSLEVGKHADVAVYDRHPFDSFTLVRQTWVDGQLVFDRARDDAALVHAP